MTPARLTLAVSALLYALFYFWYTRAGAPLSPAEADAMLARNEAAQPET